MAKRSSSSRGLRAAVVVGVLCVGAAGFILLRAVTAPPAGTGTGPGDRAFSGSRNTDLGEESGGARGLHIQMVDRNDRSRLAAVLESETLDPQQAQRYKVGRPSATIYLDDGRLVHVSSESGTLVMPDRTKAPETGTLTGDVVVRLFDARTDGRQPDPLLDKPSMVWRGASLTFDSTLGEASTTEPFVLSTDQIEFRAQDAKLLINQTLQRLERFTVRKGGVVVYRGAPSMEGDEPQAAAPERPRPDAAALAEGEHSAPPPPQSVPTAPGAAPAEQRDPIVALYQAVMRGSVELVRGGQRIQSDRLDLFARMVDSKLPEGAIANVQTSRPPTQPGDDAVGAQQPPGGPAPPPAPEPDALPPPSPAEQPETAVAAAEAPPDDTAQLSWSEELEVRPLNDEPQELRDNHLVARFTADQSGVVRFEDAQAEASGQAAVFEYSLTTRELVLSGPAQENVLLSSTSMGQARMARFELPLSTGAARVVGPGTVIGAHEDRVDWRERTNLFFKMVDGRITGELVEAECVGSARATNGEAWIEAESLHVYFDNELDGESRPRRLVARSAVRLADGRGADGSWESLEVAFDPDAEHPSPTSIDAGGGGFFRDQTGRVEAGHLFAETREDESGGLAVTKVWADGDVKFARFSDKIDVQGDKLFADADEQVLEVEREGAGARVARGPTVIAGERVRLDGRLRSAEVHGQGSFEHRAGEDATASSIVASWTEGMAFDDLAGKLECVGEVNAIHEPDVFTRESIFAAVVRAEFEPAPESPPSVDEAAGLPAEPAEDVERRVRRLYAGSEVSIGIGDVLATIESTRSTVPAAGGAQAPIERAFRISGVEILADNEAGTLDVPGRGRLFVADLRPAPEGEAASEDRGASLFDWTGSFHGDRAVGSAEMLEGVRLSHSRAADGSKTLLECARLRAYFVPNDSAEHLFSGLRSAIAETNAYLRTDTRELTADALIYDPDAGIAKALAEGAGRVRLLDRATGSPMSAAAILWDLKADRVDVVDPGSIVIPQ